MSFTQLTWPGLAIGFSVLAGLLYVLQHLRVRHRQVQVPSTLFWRQAAAAAPARSLFETFRHPLAYALLLLICGLLWLAFADPRRPDHVRRARQIAVLDGSAGLSVGNRFATTVAALKDHIRSLPENEREILWCGAEVRSLLLPGEHELLLDRRLDNLHPESTPSQLTHLLRSLAQEASPERPVEVTVFGATTVRLEGASRPGSFRVTRLDTPSPTPSAPNHGIVALGVSEPSSGLWTEVDVYAEAGSSADAPTRPLVQFTLDGQPVAAGQIHAAPAPGGSGYLLVGLPASGGLLTARLPDDDAITADNQAQIRLPNRPRLRVQLSPSLESLRGALAADSAIDVVNDGAALTLRRRGEALGADTPALEFVPRAGQAAFTIIHPARLDSNAVLREAVDAIALREVDATSLAASAAAPIEVAVEPGADWRIEIWADLLTPEFNFTTSRAFPLFLANSLRWLARTPGFAPYVAAGQPWSLPEPNQLGRPRDAVGRPVDTLGDAFTPPATGTFAVEGLRLPLVASLLDRTTTQNASDETASTAHATGDAAPTHPATWLLLAALLLLIVEWQLFQNGRLP